MYERFYNLRERPFNLSPDPEYLYPSRVHAEALSYLRYGIEGRAGFVVITGEIGSGKTTLLQATLRSVDRRTSVARLVSTLLDDRELIEAVMLDYGLDPSPGRSKPYLLRDLARYLVDQRRAGRLSLLVIDEAQNLSLAALEEIRMLSNLETEKSKLIQIVLVGQPNLHDQLDQPELEQLRQRVTVRYHLRALDPSETAAYINHRLRKAALGQPLAFPPEATDLIGRASGGLPRKINVIADAALLFGYSEDKRHVDADLVREVISELETTGVLAPPPAPTDLSAREARLALRERQVDEQHRILTEQYRLLKRRESLGPPRAAPNPRPAERNAAEALGVAAAFGPLDPVPMLDAPVQRTGPVNNPGLWSRLRTGLFSGAQAPVSRNASSVGLLDKEPHS
jgi:putative secretion ATPase (PEP-CTERM system associated)